MITLELTDMGASFTSFKGGGSRAMEIGGRKGYLLCVTKQRLYSVGGGSSKGPIVQATVPAKWNSIT